VSGGRDAGVAPGADDRRGCSPSGPPAGHGGPMAADFAGDTARLYAQFRRDLPTGQATALAEALGLGTDDVVVDLGCGTGQLTVPLRPHCAGVVAVDPEPGMLAGLRARGVPGVLCVLGADTDLLELGRLLTGAPQVGAVVVGNALHWMDERTTLRAGAELVRPGGGIGVVTQGPPLWLGAAPWQQEVRQVLEQFLGPVTGSCGSDDASLQRRVAAMEETGLAVRVAWWRAGHVVDADWVVGHLGSALPPGALQDGESGGPADALRDVLSRHPEELVEEVTTTAVVGRRPS
jgi:SAM-dependent methyltransferase